MSDDRMPSPHPASTPEPTPGAGATPATNAATPSSPAPANNSPREEPENVVETLGASTLFQLCAALIELREKNDRQHKLFEQTLAKTREALEGRFDNFAGATQKAYQNLRQEIHGEKRVGLALLNELLEVGQDLEQITRNRPSIDDREAVLRWMEAIDIEHRKVQAALLRHGIHPYDAVIGSTYDPKLHERVGSKRVEGMGPLLIAEQRERGYASQQPEFVLRRPKVVVSE
jgi:molecular chaperone GrpE (heat shock protein)